jgi:ribosomal protein S20
MKSEIKQLDAKLKNSEITESVKTEVKQLRDLVVANEHKDSNLAFESYEKAISLLN